MLRIIGKPSSINVRKVLWAAVEIGLPYTLEDWGAAGQPARATELLRLNPNGLVPVLVDRNGTLWESNTICRYLATRERRHDLLPETPMARAQVEKWMDWQATELNGAWRYAFMGLVRHSSAHADASAIRASAEQWNRLMGILDAQLRDTGGFVAGERFTLADVVLGLSVHRWLSTPIARPDLPAVLAYYERLGARPGFMEHGRNGFP